ncbi:hypothetical protein [Vulcanococcus limneticus]|uniref:hypothetical protein n=1 Tax=Vulcanococcus limneticus TaxID=2170428 RepID=UPI001E464487|nr:hypothetical protein [Vulcanococcus limneticus]MCP9793074.1 hypothetical protein [Vulcanococcus limneticus MW73D5]
MAALLQLIQLLGHLGRHAEPAAMPSPASLHGPALVLSLVFLLQFAVIFWLDRPMSGACRLDRPPLWRGGVHWYEARQLYRFLAWCPPRWRGHHPFLSPSGPSSTPVC